MLRGQPFGQTSTDRGPGSVEHHRADGLEYRAVRQHRHPRRCNGDQERRGCARWDLRQVRGERRRLRQRDGRGFGPHLRRHGIGGISCRRCRIVPDSRSGQRRQPPDHRCLSGPRNHRRAATLRNRPAARVVRRRRAGDHRRQGHPRAGRGVLRPQRRVLSGNRGGRPREHPRERRRLHHGDHAGLHGRQQHHPTDGRRPGDRERRHRLSADRHPVERICPPAGRRPPDLRRVAELRSFLRRRDRQYPRPELRVGGQRSQRQLYRPGLRGAPRHGDLGGPRWHPDPGRNTALQRRCL